MVSKVTKTTEETTNTRRKFLKGSIAAAGTAAVGFPMISNAASHSKPVVLKLQGAWGGGIFKEYAVDYVRRVNEMSGGSLKIDYLDVGAVVKTAEMQTAVSKGVIDGAHLVTAYWYSKNAAASLFGTGPCWGWTANQLLGWIAYGGGQQLYDELMNDILQLDIVGFFSGPMPAQPLGWFKKEISSVADMKGLKYRTVGLAANVMQEMGMSVVQLPGGEIQPAMERGLIDAAEFNNPTSDKDFGMQDVAKNYYLASFHQSQESFEIIFNKKKYESLSAEHKAILKYAAEAASADMSWKAQDRYSNDLVALEKEHGVKVHRTPNDIMLAQLDAWDKVLPKFMKDPYFAKVVESQKAWMKRVGAFELTNAPDYEGAYNHYFK
ncbi:TRAP transporter substrate-binding protein [Cocleimonas flava]|uniref:Secreted protein n=1 Tax=Cocleimonas flava TaxID=634765 RepID=A0A4R1F5N7_9GAMM|nr:TRAP transporter substrate-binding protein [Cocleimonas flava]TCJ87108.1 secreted protein [Cocleimonas flava]